MDQYAVIMAGGAGLRLWPLSREQRPKQFISADGTGSMLQRTIERITELIPPDKCFVITNHNYADLTQEVLGNLIPRQNIILEPLRKNTGGCISYAALLLERRFRKGSVCFIPADSYVGNKQEYLKAIRLAFKECSSSSTLTVIGVNPTYPAIGYGYINIDSDPSAGPRQISRVRQFKEKPDAETARAYVASGQYLWNSGIVAGSLQAFKNGIQQHMQEHFHILSEALDHLDSPSFHSLIEQAYTRLPDLSFDNGVLEHSSSLLAVKGDFDWDDIGSLEAFGRLTGCDSSGNAVRGSHIGMDTRDSVIISSDILIASIGLSDMMIIQTKDVILVCPKERAQDIKAFVEYLKHAGYGDFT
ncbi:mannose-1-phosphate guanylyltransferase [Paenibacillus sabinae]|uniref:Mannose-1-phosphate guanylyltransferase n=1 Tax=Paenibacillus sabinae T27 TaxID=1268072 RepID=X5A2U4_9BACL|nr:sugar phosphate nucleotidyltransferase [Paenibacillus sabinae]AHV98663.1 mannose-1-phosphate guanylyltransferase [Paenibacillus sabinae T27]